MPSSNKDRNSHPILFYDYLSFYFWLVQFEIRCKKSAKRPIDATSSAKAPAICVGSISFAFTAFNVKNRTTNGNHPLLENARLGQLKIATQATGFMAFQSSMPTLTVFNYKQTSFNLNFIR